MNQTTDAQRDAAHAAVVAVSASFLVLLLGVAAFGLDFANWTEWQGGLVGIVGTIAGVAGAVIGLQIARRPRA